MGDGPRTHITQFIRRPGRAEHGEQRRLILHVTGGPAAPQSRAFATDSITIGSADNNALSLADPTVSRYHARIELRGEAMWIRDLGSTNGTQLHGLRIERAELPERAFLRLGQSEVTAELSSEVEEFALHPQASLGKMKGQSLVMRRLFAALTRIAATDSTVMILGESGTGKELVADALHEHSPRRDGPFVVVDCGSLPPTLIEAELFGHERGAFTGAIQTRAGAFEVANGGTLFLDEIGELDLAMQPRLLRALESRKVKRVGGSDYRPVDVRVICATHRDLEQMVTTSAFREDLYHRLAVIQVRVPSLDERHDDLELLARMFAEEIASDPKAAILAPEIIAALHGRRWPGNVRELRNFIERVVVLGGLEPAVAPRGAGAARQSTPPPPAVQADADLLVWPYAQARQAVLDRFERDYVAQALLRSGGNVARAARDAQMERTYLFKLIRRHKLRDDG